jgi:CubicO group peptidase (beta-lactamase class C family)
MTGSKSCLGLPLPFLILFISVSCENGDRVLQSDRLEYSYQKPAQVDDGWVTASFTDVDMNESPVVGLMNDLLDRDDHYIHGLLIIKDGKLVFEEYFNGSDMDVFGDGLNRVHLDFDRATLHFQASVTKSVTSILVGIAVDKGLIPRVDESVSSFYPEHADLMTEEKNKITVHQMLAMCSGLSWDESTYSYDDPRSDTQQLLFSEDPIRFMLAKPVVTAPGTVFHYNSGTTNILGDIVRKTSGQLLTEFARQYLFGPLGIADFDWLRCSVATQVTFASGGLYLRPRAMAKIGQLYLQEGMWNGNRIVSAQWVRESAKQAIPLPASMLDKYHAYGYGYQWWLGKYSSGTITAYSARGWGNQYIVVLPGVDMVVVFTGGAYDENIFELPIIYYDVIQDHILPAVL